MVSLMPSRLKERILMDLMELKPLRREDPDQKVGLEEDPEVVTDVVRGLETDANLGQNPGKDLSDPDLGREGADPGAGIEEEAEVGPEDVQDHEITEVRKAREIAEPLTEMRRSLG